MKPDEQNFELVNKNILDINYIVFLLEIDTWEKEKKKNKNKDKGFLDLKLLHNYNKDIGLRSLGIHKWYPSKVINPG